MSTWEDFNLNIIASPTSQTPTSQGTTNSSESGVPSQFNKDKCKQQGNQTSHQPSLGSTVFEDKRLSKSFTQPKFSYPQPNNLADQPLTLYQTYRNSLDLETYELFQLQHSKSYPIGSPKRLMNLSNTVDAAPYFRSFEVTKGKPVHGEGCGLAHSSPSISVSTTTSQARPGKKRSLSVSTHSDLDKNANFSSPYHQKFSITLLNVNHNQPLYMPFVKVTFGDRTFQTTASTDPDGNWNQTFEFTVSYHGQLFGTCQLDLYQSSWIMPNVHCGRAEIRLACLEGFPETFKNYYELFDKKLSLGTISELTRRTNHTSNLGAIQVKIKYRFMKLEEGCSSSQFNLPRSTSPISTEPNATALPNLDQGSTDLSTRSFDSADRSAVDNRLSQAIEHPDLEADTFEKIETNPTTLSLLKGASDPTASYLQELEMDDTDTGFVSSYILSKATQTVIKGAIRVILAFHQGLEIPHLEFLSGLLLLEKFFQRPVPVKADYDHGLNETPNLPLTDVEPLSDVVHYYRFALAAYGWRGLVFFGKIPPLVPGQIPSDHQAVLTYLNLEEEQLLGYEFWGGKVFEPKYFIALDPTTDALVMSIQGTMSITDTLTDLVCEYQPWRGGLVHGGILVVAQALMATVVPKLMAFAVEHDVNQVILTGHSLGGATAALLTMMLLDHLHEFRRPSKRLQVRCLAFGPPPIVSAHLANLERYRDKILTVVCNSDIVPLLSYGSMVDFKHLLVAASEVVNDQRLKAPFQSQDISDLNLKVQLDRLKQAHFHHTSVQHLNPKLYLPGRIYHLRSQLELVPPFDLLIPKPTEDSNSTFDRTSEPTSTSSILDSLKLPRLGTKPEPKDLGPPPPHFLVYESGTEMFLEVKINTSMLLDHLPSAYDSALNKAYDLVKDLDAHRKKID